MWGVVITAAAFLAVGLSLMVWALRERSKRHEAEKATVQARVKEDEHRRLAAKNAGTVQNLEMQHGRMSEELTILRTALEKARKLLAESGDPETVKAFLDEQLKGGPV